MSFFRRKKFVVNDPDPAFHVTYLGNVVTMIAKGDGCYEKPLALIWRTYISKKRPDMSMKLVVTRSGLKAHTKQQGLTEYFVHRTTFCGAPENYPRVFVWIYKHDGKKMKPELRCHAALCRRADEPRHLTDCLHLKISEALLEYKREKLSKQNVRMSGGSLPRRKQLLSTGTQNFRPPMARSKSAPKLQSIEECLEEIDESEEEPPESPSTGDADLVSLPSDAGYSVNNSPTGGTRQNFNFPRASVDQAIPQRFRPSQSLNFDDIDKQLLSRLVLPPDILTLPPDNADLDDLDRFSDESGYEEKTSLESTDEKPNDEDFITTITCL